MGPVAAEEDKEMRHTEGIVVSLNAFSTSSQIWPEK